MIPLSVFLLSGLQKSYFSFHGCSIYEFRYRTSILLANRRGINVSIKYIAYVSLYMELECNLYLKCCRKPNVGNIEKRFETKYHSQKKCQKSNTHLIKISIFIWIFFDIAILIHRNNTIRLAIFRKLFCEQISAIQFCFYFFFTLQILFCKFAQILKIPHLLFLFKVWLF